MGCKKHHAPTPRTTAKGEKHVSSKYGAKENKRSRCKGNKVHVIHASTVASFARSHLDGVGNRGCCMQLPARTWCGGGDTWIGTTPAPYPTTSPRKPQRTDTLHAARLVPPPCTPQQTHQHQTRAMLAEVESTAHRAVAASFVPCESHPLDRWWTFPSPRTLPFAGASEPWAPTGQREGGWERNLVDVLWLCCLHLFALFLFSFLFLLRRHERAGATTKQAPRCHICHALSSAAGCLTWHGCVEPWMYQTGGKEARGRGEGRGTSGGGCGAAHHPHRTRTVCGVGGHQ